ncbi:type II secretion system protein [Rubellicoccus peritrichatus]|uniref:Type II secretion system protein n=1 Tax=Rubellicoccus peritrichatus TaxID=3080537 RepID=A0AAQ3QQJ3_9BACT|nr:type II secretion system protein [Puniceicoccus sp. CR14]WOO40313.1 type II secretion system protein [Puniceicoccus sp. CR14]
MRKLTHVYPRAFTIVELLVSVAIVAILAAIVFPVISGMVEQSRVTKDASNLRNIGVASQLFASDNQIYPGNLTIPDDSENASVSGYLITKDNNRLFKQIDPYVEAGGSTEAYKTSVFASPLKSEDDPGYTYPIHYIQNQNTSFLLSSRAVDPANIVFLTINNGNSYQFWWATAGDRIGYPINDDTQTHALMLDGSIRTLTSDEMVEEIIQPEWVQ